MNDKNLIQQMNAYGQRKIEEAKQQELDLDKEKELLIQQIRDLKPRIEKIIKIGNVARDNNIIKTYCDFTYFDSRKRENGYFETDGWYHRLGFVGKSKYVPITELGIEGGGACAYNLTTDGTAVKVEGKETIHVLKRFVEEFDQFEKELLEYITKTIQK